MLRVTAPFQQTGIPALETEGKHIEGNVRPGFVDNPDHPERNADLPELQPIREHPVHQHAPQRVGQGNHLPHIGRNPLQAFFRKLEPVIQRIRRFPVLQILGIGRKQGVRFRNDGIGQPEQNSITRFIGEG